MRLRRRARSRAGARACAAAALLAAFSAVPAAARRPMDALRPDAAFPSAKDFYEPLVADPTELGYGGRMIYPPGGARYGEIMIGDYVGLTRWRLTERWGAQLNLGGGAIGRFNLTTERNSMEVVDFSLAVPFDVEFDRTHVLRLAWWHTSSHLGDDYMARVRPLLQKRAYDALRAMYSWTPSDKVRVYGGGSFAFNQINLGGREALQGGLELRSPEFRERYGLFLAQDAQFFSRVGWNPSYNIRGGVRFSDAKRIAAASVFMEYFTGHPYYLQFKDLHESHWGFGLRFEIGNPTR